MAQHWGKCCMMLFSTLYFFVTFLFLLSVVYFKT